MLKRTITGAILTVLMGVVLYFSYIPEVMTGTCIVLSAFSVYEICRATGWVNNEACFHVNKDDNAGTSGLCCVVHDVCCSTMSRKRSSPMHTMVWMKHYLPAGFSVLLC